MVAENEEELSTVEDLLLHLCKDKHEGKAKVQSAFFPSIRWRSLPNPLFTPSQKVLKILLAVRYRKDGQNVSFTVCQLEKLYFSD